MRKEIKQLLVIISLGLIGLSVYTQVWIHFWAGVVLLAVYHEQKRRL